MAINLIQTKPTMHTTGIKSIFHIILKGLQTQFQKRKWTQKGQERSIIFGNPTFITNKKLEAVCLILFAFSSVSNAQNELRGHIIDKDTKEPLPYVIVVLPNQQIGTYTDTLGAFFLKTLNDCDSVKISHMGYATLYSNVHTLKKRSCIQLEAKPVQLPQVIVSPQKYKTKTTEMGIFVKKPDTFMVPSYQVNQQAAHVPFPKDGNIAVIQFLRFNYLNANTGKNYPVRIRILRTTSKGEPGEDLITENIIFRDEKSRFRSVAKIDLRKFNLQMPREGIFIVWEWIGLDRSIGDFNYRGQFGPFIGAMNSSSISWANFLESQKWTKLNDPKTYSFGLTVKEYKNGN